MSMLSDILDSLFLFKDTLQNFEKNIDDMINSINSGSSCNGLPLIECIATYRYFVGDFAFLLTYSLILFGCLWTIYKLLILIKDRVLENFDINKFFKPKVIKF